MVITIIGSDRSAIHQRICKWKHHDLFNPIQREYSLNISSGHDKTAAGSMSCVSDNQSVMTFRWEKVMAQLCSLCTY